MSPRTVEYHLSKVFTKLDISSRSQLLAIAVGIIALAWPGVTVLAIVTLFAVYTFIGAGLQAISRSVVLPRDRSSATFCSGWSTSRRG